MLSLVGKYGIGTTYHVDLLVPDRGCLSLIYEPVQNRHLPYLERLLENTQFMSHQPVSEIQDRSMTYTTMEMVSSRTIPWRRRTKSPGGGCCSHHNEEDEAVINYLKVLGIYHSCFT